MYKKNTATAFIIGAIASAIPLQSDAALTTFSDRGTFSSTYPGLVTEDFESVSSISEVLASTNIISGLKLSLTIDDEAYLAPAGQSSNPTQAIGVDFPRGGGWQISFVDSTSTMGFDIFQNDGGGDQFGVDRSALVEVYGSSGLLGSYNITVQSGLGGFFGVFSDTDAITYVTVNDPGSFDVIDNVSFEPSSVSPIPEPSGMAVLGALLVGGMMLRNRRKTQ